MKVSGLKGAEEKEQTEERKRYDGPMGDRMEVMEIRDFRGDEEG